MANTFTKIASVTVGSGGATSIDFSSIPATYTDVCILLSSRSNRAATSDYIKIAFNGVTTNQTMNQLYGTGSAVGAQTDTLIYAFSDAANATANTFDNFYIYVPNYAGSNYKSVSIDSVMENNATAAYSTLTAGLWSSTSAINQITLSSYYSENLLQYSTATLYGIKNS